MTEPVSQTTGISHAQFSELAARLAQKAAHWAADCLALKTNIHEPMRPETLATFTREIANLLEAINGR